MRPSHTFCVGVFRMSAQSFRVLLNGWHRGKKEFLILPLSSFTKCIPSSANDCIIICIQS